MVQLSEAQEEALLPKVLPAGWKRVEFPCPSFTDFNLKVIFTASLEDDGNEWIHVSVSRMDGRIPTWTDMCLIKHIFIATNRYACQIHPPKENNYSLRGVEVLHLWARVDGKNSLPDFLSARGGTL